MQQNNAFFLEGYALTGGAGPGSNSDLYQMCRISDLEMTFWGNSIMIMHVCFRGELTNHVSTLALHGLLWARLVENFRPPNVTVGKSHKSRQCTKNA